MNKVCFGNAGQQFLLMSSSIRERENRHNVRIERERCFVKTDLRNRVDEKKDMC